MTYQDITILKFQEIQAAIELYPDNELAQWYSILPLFSDKTKEQYKAMNILDFYKEVDKFKFIEQFEPPDEWVKDFTIKGEKYFVSQYATDWNVEQYISMTTLTKDKDQIVNNLHQIIATLCYKKKGEDVTLTEFNRRSELFQNHLPILTAYPIGFFFAAFLAKLSQSTPYSLMLKRALKKARKINGQGNKRSFFKRSGVGTLPLWKYFARGIE